MTADPSPAVSVVVVTRNEADRIDDCLASVFELCRPVVDFEVVVVDSNSTDDSVARAAEHPVSILRIPSDDLATPSAGRYVGTHYASGDRLLFVDGDMRLESGWLDHALAALDEPGVAGVTGHLNDVPSSAREEPVDALRGVALYEADALASVGGFDPYLKASEDVDLGFRLRAAGYRLRRLPTVVASHPAATSLSEPVRRWQRGYFHGAGQAVRKSTDSPPVLVRHLFSLRHSLFVAAWAAAGVAAAGRSSRLFGAWAVASSLAVGGYALRSGLRASVVDLSSFALTAVGLVLGGCEPRRRAEQYPLDEVEVVEPRHLP